MNFNIPRTYRIIPIVKKGLIRGYMPQKRFLYIWFDMKIYPVLSYSLAERIIEND